MCAAASHLRARLFFARESFTEQLTTRAAREDVHLLTAADLFAS